MGGSDVSVNHINAFIIVPMLYNSHVHYPVGRYLYQNDEKYIALTLKGQTESLEIINRNSVRICHGAEAATYNAVQALGIDTLEARKEKRCDLLLKKAIRSPRFANEWFPTRGDVIHNLRNRREIAELNPRSRRRFNSALAFLRRGANGLGLCPNG